MSILNIRDMAEREQVTGGIRQIQIGILVYLAPVLGIIGFTIVGMLYLGSPPITGNPVFFATAVFASLTLLSSPLLFSWHRSIAFGGWLLIVTVWLALTTGAVFSGGIQAPQIVLLAQLPIWAAIFDNKRGAAISVGGVLASFIVCFVLGDRFMVGDPNAEQTLNRVALVMSILATSTVVVLIMINNYVQSDLRRATNQARRADRAKSEFLSAMSHELRTPLNSILGFAQILEAAQKQNKETGNAVVATNNILRSGHHLLDLINEILDLSRLETGQIEINMEHVGLDQMLDECLATVMSQADAMDLSVENDVPSGLAVYVDRVRLRQVLLNLLSNAIKYNRTSGDVRLSLQRNDGETMRIAVHDTGRGIDPSDREKVFMPFDRLSAADEGIEGTGIGLTISKRLVEAMGGQIGFNSAPGIGSVFWIEVQRGEAPANEVKRPVKAETHEVDDRPEVPDESLPLKVLYIEDNPANVQLMQMILDNFDRVRFATAHNGELGLVLARNFAPDVVLLDINLPGINGYDVLRQLREQAGTASIPIIGISANAMPYDIARAEEAGFDGYVTKPFDIDDIYKRLEPYLKPARSQEERA